jgi:hypothetical protein
VKITVVKEILPLSPNPRSSQFSIRINKTLLRKQISCDMVIDIIAWATSDPFWSKATIEVPVELADYLKTLESAVSISGLLVRVRTTNGKIVMALKDHVGDPGTVKLPDPLKEELRSISEVTNSVLLMYDSLMVSTSREYRIDGQNTVVYIKHQPRGGRPKISKITLKRNNITVSLWHRRLTVSEFYNILFAPVSTFVGLVYREFYDSDLQHPISIYSPTKIELRQLTATHSPSEVLKMIETALENDLSIVGLEALSK